MPRCFIRVVIDVTTASVMKTKMLVLNPTPRSKNGYKEKSLRRIILMKLVYFQSRNK